MIQKRDVIVAIILSIVTCGIYSLIWFINLTNDANTACGTPNDTSGGVALLLTILTCGIYSFYWAYKVGEKLDKKTGTTDKKLIYLVLTFFGLGIVVYALMQDTLNKLA